MEVNWLLEVGQTHCLQLLFFAEQAVLLVLYVPVLQIAGLIVVAMAMPIFTS